MKPIFAIAKKAVAGGGSTRIVFCEGEDERVLRAVQVVIDEAIARPTVIGRPAVLASALERFGLRMIAGVTSRWSIRSPIRATATTGAAITADGTARRD